MRNLKRALSLAMASVMLLGLMVVGTGASYKDVASDQNVEAIEVLQAVGVMVGDEKGNFNPDQNVTRNEMAVIMANLMDYRVASYAGTSPFTDVPEWAEPYVAACYTNGITSGVSATQYGGDQTVTTAQAALMLLKALGYFQTQKEFGDSWQLATITKANEIDLLMDVESGVIEAMTRNDVAQLVLNTLEAGTVKASDDSFIISGGGMSVEGGKVEYIYNTSGDSYARAIESNLTTTNTSGTTVGNNIVQLGEKLYQGNLKMSGVTTREFDGFNAPARKWTYNSAEIGTYADKADYVFEGSVKASAMYAAVGKTVAREYNWIVNLDGNDLANGDGTARVFAQDYANGVDTVKSTNNATLTGTGRGTTTYVYLDDENDDVYVCIVSSYVAEVIQEDDGTITLDDQAGSLDFDIEGYEEDDVVVYTKSSDDNQNWTVESVLGLATYVEGDVTKVKDVDTVVIDDTTYQYNTTMFAGDKITIDSYNQTVGFYLDLQGHIGMVDTAIESGDYAYVLSMGFEGDKYGEADATIYAKLVLADGTIARVEVDDDNYVETKGDATQTFIDTAAKYGLTYSAQGQKTGGNGSIVTYVVNEDGTYSMNHKVDGATQAANELKIEKGITGIKINNSTSMYGDANTVYIYSDGSDADDYSAYVGYKSVPDIDAAADGTTVAAAYAKNGVAKFVFVTGATTTASADDIVFVIGRTGEANNRLIKTNAGNYYEYAAVVDGETSTIRIKEGSDAHTAYVNAMAGKADKTILVFAGATTNSLGLTTDLGTNMTADGAGAGDLKHDVYTGVRRANASGLIGFVYSNGDYSKWLGADDDAIVAYYESTGNTLSEVGDVSTLKTDTNDIAHVITDDGVIIAIVIDVK